MTELPEKHFTTTNASPLIFFLLTAGIVVLGTAGLHYYGFLEEMPLLWLVSISGLVVIFIISIMQYYYHRKLCNYRYGDENFTDLRSGDFYKWEELIWYKLTYSYSGKKIESLVLHFQTASRDIRLEGIAELAEIYELIKAHTKSRYSSTEDDIAEWNIPSVFKTFMWKKTLRQQLNIKNILMGTAIIVVGVMLVGFFITTFSNSQLALSAMIFMAVGMVFVLGIFLFIMLNSLNSFVKTIIMPDGLILLTQTDARKIFLWHGIVNMTKSETSILAYIEIEYCNGETFQFGVDRATVKLSEIMTLFDKYVIKKDNFKKDDNDQIVSKELSADPIISIDEAPEELTQCVANSDGKQITVIRPYSKTIF